MAGKKKSKAAQDAMKAVQGVGKFAAEVGVTPSKPKGVVKGGKIKRVKTNRATKKR